MTWGFPYPAMDIDDSGDLLLVGHNSDIFLYQRKESTFLQLHTYTWVQTVKGITIVGDGSRCFVGGNSGEILIIDLVTFTIIQTLPSLGMGRITIINTNQDGSYLAAGYNAGCLAVYKGSTSYAALNGSPITGFSNPKNELITAKNFTLFFMNTISVKVHVFERNETHVWYVKEVDGVDDFAVSEDGGYFAGDVT
jgi:WD40 repeat protein